MGELPFAVVEPDKSAVSYPITQERTDQLNQEVLAPPVTSTLGIGTESFVYYTRLRL